MIRLNVMDLTTGNRKCLLRGTMTKNGRLAGYVSAPRTDACSCRPIELICSLFCAAEYPRKKANCFVMTRILFVNCFITNTIGGNTFKHNTQESTCF